MKTYFDADLQKLHTFGLPAKAAALCVLDNVAQLPAVLDLPAFDPKTVVWLGGGSNVLFMSGRYDGLVVKTAMRGIRLLSEDENSVRLAAAAGENWHDFVCYTLSRGWSGLENLSLIPGTVGAAPVQNIGAYGVEAGGRIESVRVFDLHTARFDTLGRDDCRFTYRDSLFKQQARRYLIVEVVWILDKTFRPVLDYGDLRNRVAAETGSSPTPFQVARTVCAVRREKLPDPAVLGNCGSFYHNPAVAADTAAALQHRYPDMPQYPQNDGRVKLAAGWLIDRCGLKNHAIGGAAVHDKQALVLINRNGQATAEDVRRLSDHIRACVRQRFGVELVCEPQWL